MANILIIDDEKPVRLMLRKMLEAEGYDVTDAANGNEGIRLYHENPTDLIVTDIIMPDKEGTETILELKKENPAIKIIAMSGGGRNRPEGYLLTAELLGAVRTFAKPIRRDELLTAIQELLGN